MKSSNKEIFDILVKHILKIFDENDNEISFNNLELKEEKRKFSSKCCKLLYIDNICITSKQRKSYKILYKCRCGRENKILLHKYINKDKLVCQHCLQDRSFDYYSDTKPYSLIKGLRSKKIINQNKDLIFENMDEDFKNKYKKNHLNENEFFKYLPYIYQINNHIIDNLDNIKYLYYYPTNNQFKFTSKVSFDNGLNYESVNQIKLKCSICGKIFNIHPENLRNKDLSNIKCKTCGLNNHRYIIQLFDESGLTYQSQIEKYFIEQCYKYNIKINNGLEIPYYFNNSMHTYISDFYLPEFRYIIEIKSNNIWYKKDLESGKIKAKENGALEFGKNQNIKFKLLFDQDIDVFIKNILDERYSLNN